MNDNIITALQKLRDDFNAAAEQADADGKPIRSALFSGKASGVQEALDAIRDLDAEKYRAMFGGAA